MSFSAVISPLAVSPSYLSPMTSISRSQLKAACEQENWDLLDLLLETDATQLDDNALFTDTWGDWWGLLMEVIYRKAPDGLRVLLKHGACRDTGLWGDGMPQSPLEAAADQPEILALLQDPAKPAYTRQTNPPLPVADPALDELGCIRDATGLVFQAQPAIEPSQDSARPSSE